MLLVSSDPVLVEQVRLAAAGVGVPCAVSADPVAARAPVAALLVLGADVLASHPPGPADLVVVRDDVPGARPRAAVPVHPLPCDRDALARAIVSRVRRGPQGVAVGVLGAVGGAGASTLALALAAAADGWLVDADPVRSCTEAVTGGERVAGARWPDLADVDGPLPPGLLADRLPRADGVPVLGWSALSVAGPGAGPTPAALGSVLGAGRAEVAVVAVDLPAGRAATAGPTWRLLDAAVLVVPDEVAAAVAGRRLLTALRLVLGAAHVVVRERRGGGPGVRAVAEVLGVQTGVRWRPHPALGRAADDGDLVAAVRRGPTAAVAAEVLAAVTRA